MCNFLSGLSFPANVLHFLCSIAPDPQSLGSNGCILEQPSELLRAKFLCQQSKSYQVDSLSKSHLAPKIPSSLGSCYALGIKNQQDFSLDMNNISPLLTLQLAPTFLFTFNCNSSLNSLMDSGSNLLSF